MYTYERFNLRLFPLFLLIIGTALIISKLYLQGGIMGTVGALLIISFRGLNIDPEKMLIRKYDRFLWLYFGKWSPLPPPLYVTVVRININNSRNNPLPMPTGGAGKAAKTYKINLVVDSKERYIPINRGNRRLMLDEGLKIARILNIKLLDHTTIDKIWLN